MRSPTRHVRGCVALLAALALVLAACGNGEDETDDAPDPDVEEPDEEPDADDPDEDEPEASGFYQDGDQIELIIPASPGGGADTTARLVGPYLAEKLGADVSVVMENIEGGGTILGSNEYYLQRPADGYHLLLASASTLGAWAIGQPEVEFELDDFTFLTGVPSGMVFFASPELGIEEPADILNPDTPIVLGNTSATGIGTLSLLAFELLDLDDVQLISGYEGAGAARVAFEQGEINIANQTGQAYQSGVLPLVEAGEAVPLFTLGVPGPDGTVIEDPALPEIPTIVEFYNEIYGEDPSGEVWDALNALMGIVPYLPIVIHSDAPQEAIDELVAALRDVADDPAFDEARLDVAGDYPLWVGDEWAPIEDTLQNFDPEVKAWVQDWLETEHGVAGLER